MTLSRLEKKYRFLQLIDELFGLEDACEVFTEDETEFSVKVRNSSLRSESFHSVGWEVELNCESCMVSFREISTRPLAFLPPNTRGGPAVKTVEESDEREFLNHRLGNLTAQQLRERMGREKQRRESENKRRRESNDDYMDRPWDDRRMQKLNSDPCYDWSTPADSSDDFEKLLREYND